MKSICLFCSAVVIAFVLALGTTAYCEVYQYTDENGVLRFTDDASNIPEDQLPNVETFESLNKPAPRPPSSAKREESPSKPDTSTWAGEVHAEAKELEAMRQGLQKQYEALQAEKKALGDAPSEHTKSTEKADYIYQVTELNRKIERYQQRSEEFKKKLEAFNQKIGRE